MNRIFTVLILLFSLTNAQAQKAAISVQLKGGAPGNTRLIGVYGNQNIAIDSAMADATGKVIFKKDSLYPAGFYYIVYGDNSALYALLDKDQEFSLTTTKENFIDDAKIEGSLDNELYYRNLRFEKQFRPRLDSVNSIIKTAPFGTPQYENAEKARQQLEAEKEEHLNTFKKEYPNSYFTIFKTQGQNPKWKDLRKPNGELDTLGRFYAYRNEYWQGFDFNDERQLRSPVYYNKLNNWLTTLIPQHQDSLVAAADFIIPKTYGNDEYYKFTVNFIAMTYKQGKLMDWEKVYSHIVLKYITYDKAKWADSSSIKRTRNDATDMSESFLYMNGQDVEGTDEKGQKHRIYEIQKPYIIVFLYNPDCEHCKEEAPQLEKFYQEWKDKGVGVFALSLEQKDVNRVVEFRNRYGWSFPALWDPGFLSLRHKYYVDITPEVYVLGPDKKIIGKNLHINQLAEFLGREMGK